MAELTHDTDALLHHTQSYLREVLSYSEVDVQSRPVAAGVRPFKPKWLFYVECALSIWLLFNAISTTMIIVTNFRSTVPSANRVAFGSHLHYQVVIDTVTYFPLLFFVLIVLVFNNHYAERDFYDYLQRGVIIDFPDSGSVAFMRKHVAAVGFVIVFVAYVIFAVTVLIVYEAAVGTIVVFLSNLVVGVGILWFNQQSIEDRFVSISDFIQSFPDSTGDYDNIDATSLKAAAAFLKDLTLAEFSQACYSNTIRLRRWQHVHMNESMRNALRVGLLAVIVALAGACMAYFYLQDVHLETVNWRLQANPCVEACLLSNTTRPCGWCVETCQSVLRLSGAKAACEASLTSAGGRCSTGDCSGL